MGEIIDIHTHRSVPGYGIQCVSTGGAVPTGYFSAGIHPMQLHRATDTDWLWLDEIVCQPMCVAIGETGFDKRAEASEALQRAAFERHVQLSEQLGKPLIIHCVRSLDQLLAAHRELRPQQKWLWHGFRGTPRMAEQLRRHGIHYSFGPHFNPASAAATPLDELYLETDDDYRADIYDVASAIARAKGIGKEDVVLQVLNNMKTFVPLR